jgi:hypothetical protein
LADDLGFVASQPPVVSPGQATTHQDLAVTVDLNSFTTDADGNPVYYRIVSAQNGTATLNPDGHTVTFLPAVGYTGPASFEFQADDGYSTSPADSVAVTVSSAPLVSLDFTQRALFLLPGNTQQEGITGDFADQTGVTLPPSYVTFQTLDPTVATVTQVGVVTGVAEGSTVLEISSHGIDAVTVLNVGDPVNEPVADFLGLGVYPQALSLPSNGSRQLEVSLNGQDVSAATSGTLYFVTNPNIVQVSANGLVTAVGLGSTTVTIIENGQEIIVPVTVTTPVTGPAMVGKAGAIVSGPNGALVQIPQGALSQPTQVSLTAYQGSLPLALPSWVTSSVAFNLDVGSTPLNQPLELAIPMPGVAAGTTVVFYQLGSLPDGSGGTVQLWMQDDSGIVGIDGIARPASNPPHILATGLIVAAAIGVETALLTATIALAAGFSGAGAFLLGTTVGATAAISLATSLTSQVANVGISAPFGPVTVKMIAIPRIGPPLSQTQQLYVSAGAANTFQTSFTPDPSLEPKTPQIAFLKLDFSKGSAGPLLDILGQNLMVPGYQLPDVWLTPPGDVGRQAATIVGTPTPGLLQVQVPNTWAVGTLTVSITEQDPDTGQSLDSNDAQLQPSGQNLFVAMASTGQGGGTAGQVGVIGADPNSPTYNQLIAEIPLGKNGYPQNVALTSDNTRAYVTDPGNHGIAVIDTMALQEIAANPKSIPNSERSKHLRNPPAW